MNPRSDRRERAAWTASILSLYAIGYFWLGWTTDPDRARSLATSLDDLIPFVPGTVYVYGSIYTAMFLPLFVVRSASLFRRVAAAYAVVIAVSFASFAVLPVSGAGLREPMEALSRADFSQWAVRLIYRLDPPFNLFPSIHLSVATLAVLAAWQARRAYGWIAGCWWLAMAISICTVKQHFAVDGIAGIALAGAAYAACTRGLPVESEEERAFGWGGPALYLCFYGAFVAAAYAVYRVGA